MKTRKWESKTKANIVLEGLNGKNTIAEICNRHQISQGQYYKWRDDFLKNMHKVFEAGKENKTVQDLKRQNDKLKKVVGDLTMELKKRDRILEELEKQTPGITRRPKDGIYEIKSEEFQQKPEVRSKKPE